MSFNIPSPSFSQVFQNSFPFYVPKYQRGYAWEREEVDDFIKDIRALITSTPAETHFMGGLVHVSLPAANVVSRNHEIVDGQQRMVTFSLAILAILNGLGQISESSISPDTKNLCTVHAEQIREAFLEYRDIVGGQRVTLPKLTLSHTDNSFFRELMNGKAPVPTRESHTLIRAAYTLIENELVVPLLSAGLSEEDALQRLLGLYRTLSERCVVIHIVSRDRPEAYRLFSVLNDRGRSLSAGDLLRARTLEILEGDASAQDTVEAFWDDILDVNADKTEKYLRTFFPSLTGSRAPSKDLYGTFKKEFLTEEANLEERTVALVTSLAHDKTSFSSIIDGEWPFEPGNSDATNWDKDRLHRLVNILRHEAAHPLLLSAVYLGERKFSEVVHLIEKFAFRYITICGAHPSPVYAPYNEEALRMRSEGSAYSIASLQARLATLINARASDTNFIELLHAKLQYSDSSSNNRIIRHFLSTIESYKRSVDRGDARITANKMTVFDVMATTIEHIYSRNTQASLQNPELEVFKNALANLTLMAANDNSILGSPPFPVKKLEYFKSEVGLTRDLNNYADWTLMQLEDRVEVLNDLALKVFGL